MIDTSSIPPLMSVRSELPPTDYYENENLYYESNHQHYPNRGYSALGAYGRHRRSDTQRQQQQQQSYSNYNTNVSSSAPTNRSKKNGNSNRKEEITKKSSSIDEESIVKPLQSLVLSPKIDNEKVNGSTNGLAEQKSLPKTQKRSTKEQQYQTPKYRNTSYSQSIQGFFSFSNSILVSFSFHFSRIQFRSELLQQFTSNRTKYSSQSSTRSLIGLLLRSITIVRCFFFSFFCHSKNHLFSIDIIIIDTIPISNHRNQHVRNDNKSQLNLQTTTAAITTIFVIIQQVIMIKRKAKNGRQHRNQVQICAMDITKVQL